jgi:hypothetical protein
MTNGNESGASRWSPEVLAYNDPSAIAERVAECEAQRGSGGGRLESCVGRPDPGGAEAQLAAEEAEEEAYFDQRRAEIEEDRAAQADRRP